MISILMHEKRETNLARTHKNHMESCDGFIDAEQTPASK